MHVGIFPINFIMLL